MKRLGIAGWIGLLLVMAMSADGVQAQDDLYLDATFGVHAIRLLAESYIKGLIESMHVMTATANLQTGDWSQMETLLAQFEESELSYSAWYLMTDGRYYKVGTGLAASNLSDRDYYTRVMAGETTRDDLLVSRSTGRKSMVLTAPIYNGAAVIGALGVTLYLDSFSRLLHDQLRLPDGIGFYAYRSEDSTICLHASADLLLEPLALAGISLAHGGSEGSDFLGWTFLLGPIE